MQPAARRAAADAARWAARYPVRRSGSNSAILVASLPRIACQRSQSCWSPNQKSADIPRTRASRRAVSGVTVRLPRTISFSLGNEIPKRTAKADWLMPRGRRNSCSSISPGCVGGFNRGSRRATRLRRRRRRLPPRRLVVIRDFDFERIALFPTEADSILIVDPGAVLPLSIPSKPLQAISGRNCELADVTDAVNLRQLPPGDGPQLGRANRSSGPGFGPIENVLRATICKGAYHGSYYNARRIRSCTNGVVVRPNSVRQILWP